ncbi:MAG TPA: hypothetical protein VGD89_09505 [Flavipsychrobacter sp.]
MKLYSKQLNSLEELRREKRMLKRAIKESEKEGFFPGSKKEGKENSDETGDILSAATGLFSGSPLGSLAMAVGMPLLKQAAGKKIAKSGGKILGSLLKEVGFSYLKWKAVELGIKGVKQVIKKRKEKMEKQKAHR